MMPNVDEMIAENIANGFYEVSIDEEGEFFFRLSDNAARVNPELYLVHMADLNIEIAGLVNAGLVSEKIDENGEQVFCLTEAGEVFANSIEDLLD